MINRRPEKLNPNYTPIANFYQLVDASSSEHSEKLRQLAIDIGNCLWKVRLKPLITQMRELKKFFIQSRWFKKVRIIHRELYLFRRKGRFAIILNQAQIYSLKILAKEMRLARAH